MSGDEIESSQSDQSEDSQPPVAELPVKVTRPRIKLDAERLLEDNVNGIQKVFTDFPNIDLLQKDDVCVCCVSCLRMFFRTLRLSVG